MSKQIMSVLLAAIGAALMVNGDSNGLIVIAIAVVVSYQK